MRNLLSLAAVGVVIAASGNLTAQSGGSGPYKVLKMVKVGGEGGKDYISADSEGRRLLVPRNGPNGRVTIYNLDTLEPVGDVPASCGGAVEDPKSGHGFATTKPVTMWDMKTNAVIRTIDVPGRPDGILFDPFNERVWMFSRATSSVDVINAVDGSVAGSISLGGAPESSVTDGKGHVYVNLTDKAVVAAIDARSLTVTARYDLNSKGSNAGGLAFDAKNHILFSYIHNPSSMAVILNSDTGDIITTLPVGNGVDTTVFNPDTMEAISGDGADGTMTIIKEDSPMSFVVEQTLKTMADASTVALDTKTGRVFSMAAEFEPAPAAPPAPPAGAAPAGAPGAGGGRGGRGRRTQVPGSFTLIEVGRR